MLRLVLCLLILTTITTKVTHAQDYNSDYLLIMNQHIAETKKKNKLQFIHYTPPYWIYQFGQKMIKPQIAISERFEMKLGQFTKNSFKEFGPIKGYFMSIDRINRTGRLGYVDFSSVRQTQSGLIIDLPKYYRLK